MISPGIKKIYFFWILGCFISSFLHAQLSVSGNWAYSVSSTEITEAGNDFTGTYESANNQVYINVNRGLFTDFLYRIEVRKEDVDWDSRLQLQVRRTGDGIGLGGYVQGGTSYQTITDTDQYFFDGRRSRWIIALQYRVNNVSVIIPAKTHSTTVVYTYIEE